MLKLAYFDCPLPTSPTFSRASVLAPTVFIILVRAFHCCNIPPQTLATPSMVSIPGLVSRMARTLNTASISTSSCLVRVLLITVVKVLYTAVFKVFPTLAFRVRCKSVVRCRTRQSGGFQLKAVVKVQVTLVVEAGFIVVRRCLSVSLAFRRLS